MAADVTADMNQSTANFDVWVRPVLLRLIGGEITRAEGRHDAIGNLLDYRSGIDAFHINSRGEVRGIASRIQPAERSWDTFTIRVSRHSGAETEYGKGVRALVDPSIISAALHVQAYVTDYAVPSGGLHSVAVISKRKLFDAVASGLGFYRVNGNDMNTFVAVRWSDLQRRGVPMKVWRAASVL